jgi:hypothetical protein
MAKTLLDTSALMPALKELMKFADTKSIADIVPAMPRANGEKAPALPKAPPVPPRAPVAPIASKS